MLLEDVSKGKRYLYRSFLFLIARALLALWNLQNVFLKGTSTLTTNFDVKLL